MIILQDLVNNHIENLSKEQEGKVKSCYRTFMANVCVWDELSTYEKLPATRQIYDVIHSIKLITGLMTDEAIASYKNIPHVDYENRKLLLKNFKQIKKIIPQDSLDYSKNLNLVKQDYVVHGDDWR